MARILVVEDEADIREVLDYNLKREGHDVALASTAKDGLRQARERRPDLVLLDSCCPTAPAPSFARRFTRTRRRAAYES